VKTIKVLLSIFGVLFLCFIGMERLENPKSSFVNFNELAESGLIERGWLPSYFPKSATNIFEQHNIDTNEVFASFNYLTSDIASLLKYCSLLSKTDLSQKLACSAKYEHTYIFVLNKNGSGKFYSVYNGI